ncbi:SpoIIE family protein phosphatase [Streptomyces sp. NK08204]|uniref:SpoIIE family protein phosphatase n=1 Tax=Streptomyces sp. NK08204 TaxID=2873260 RepID=UPI001CEDAC7A|nr:SpoIIE family protein phosphatase [Streptomyces sp. NK08204]
MPGPALAGAAVAAVYLLDGAVDALALLQTAARPPDHRGLARRYELTNRSPVTDAFREGRLLWLDAAALAAYGHVGAAPGMSMGVVPFVSDAGRSGCLVVVEDRAEGFGPARRSLVELCAPYVAARLGGDRDPLTGIGAFTLAVGSGRIEADRGLLGLAGIEPEEFDGRVETLLGCVMPDDLPTLTALAGPGRSGTGELEFRVRRRGAGPCRLTLRYRFGDETDLMLGVVAQAPRSRPRSDDLSVLRPLTAILRASLKADRMALAEVAAGRLVVGVLDPPDPTGWPRRWRPACAEPPELPMAALPTVRAALRTGRPARWPDGTAEPEPVLAEVGPGALVVLPLHGQGPVAALYVVGWDAPHPLGSDERSLLAVIAGQAGQALARARAVDARHRLATVLQRSLLPPAPPALPGAVAVARYLPATDGLEVGGDWYDVVPLPDSHVALVVGDVQGHSAGAATVMSQIRTAIRAYAVEGHPPDVVATHANRLLLGMQTELFATCLYADLNLEDGSCWLVRAGHPRPLLRHPDGRTEEVAVDGGPPLGVLADAEYVIGTTDLTPGSVLTLLTDGLLGPAGPALEDGALRLREALSHIDPGDPDRAADALLDCARRHDDDAALLLLRYDGMKDKPIRAGATVWRLPDAVMHARRYVKRTLKAWNVAEEADEVMLIVSELVTNALVHTQGPVRFDLTLSGDRLRVAVSDSSPRTPVKPASLDWEATGGRGLLLVEAMAAAWGSVPLSGGKQVWGEITLASRSPAAEPATDQGRPV